MTAKTSRWGAALGPLCLSLLAFSACSDPGLQSRAGAGESIGVARSRIVGLPLLIGDVDGFGYAPTAGLFSASGGPADTDGDGILEPGEFLPDLNRNGSVAVGSVGLTLIDQPLFPSSEVVRSLALSLLVLGLWALIGLGIGILIPNQVAALLIGIGVAWIVEPLLGLALGAWEFGREHIVEYLPSQATSARFGGSWPAQAAGTTSAGRPVSMKAASVRLDSSPSMPGPTTTRSARLPCRARIAGRWSMVAVSRWVSSRTPWSAASAVNSCSR